MTTPEDKLNESDVTFRLFELIASMPEDYVIEDNESKGLVKDISVGGAFLKPNEVKSLSIGQEVLLVIPCPDN
jgi:hypothetical protein